MKKIFNKKNIVLALLSVSVIGTFTSCNKDYINPSTASTGNVTQNTDALINLAIGLQRRYTFGRQSPCYNFPVAGGYSVFALRTTNTGNLAETELEGGRQAVSNVNAMVSSLWSQLMFGKNESEILLSGVNVATDPGDKVGLKAYGSIFYALNVGGALQFYEKLPIVTQANATFNSREEVLNKVIQILESADADLATTNPSAKFLSRVPAGMDAKNTVKALLARYYNMLSMVSGTYNSTAGAKAIANAAAVNLTVKSEFRFSALTLSSFGDLASGGNVFAAVDSSLGLRNGLAPVPAATDPRVGYYIRNAGGVLLMKGFGLSGITAMPVYLPGEMGLIVAECNARAGAANLAASKTALDAVRTKTTDAFGIGASQPAYSGPLTTIDLLNDIYKQRRLELFLSGMELEDSRRFARNAPNAPTSPATPIVATAERNRFNYYPYPITERNNNTNTPNDPSTF
jgi:starch-binding outer membrane protein, SusD/RagB family